MGKFKIIDPLSAGVALLMASSLGLFTAAKAFAANSPVTFAQFVQDGTATDTNLFTYIDNGPDADAVITTQSGGVNGVAIPVIFTFQSVSGSMPADLIGPQDATLTLTSSTTDAVSTADIFGERLAHQEIFGNGSETDTLTITRDSAAGEGGGARTDLLTMTFTGALLGRLGSTTPTLSGDTSNGDTVVYTSDFLTFSPTAEDDFNTVFTSWTSTADGNGLEMSPTADDSYFATATAAATATFDSTFTPVIVVGQIPEPRMIGWLGVFAIAGLTMRPRRSAAC